MPKKRSSLSEKKPSTLKKRSLQKKQYLRQRKNPKKWHCDPIIIIAAIFFIYGLFKSLTTTHEDCYAVVFAWLSFTIIWAIIAVLRYQNLRGKC